MATTHSRHHGNYARPAKTLPITQPSKTSTTYNHPPVSRVAMSPPELDEASTVYSGSRRSGTLSDISDDYYESRAAGGIDVMDELVDRVSNMYTPTKMDRSIVTQAQTSGSLNAKQRELQELQARASQRARSSKVKFDQFNDRAREAREDLEHTQRSVAAMKEKAAKRNPEAYEEARRSRQSRR